MELRLISPRGAREIQLLVAREAGLREVEVEGRRIEVREIPVFRARVPDHDVLTVVALPPEGVEVSLRLESLSPHDHLLYDNAAALPSTAAGLLEARAPLAVPVHRGDRWSQVVEVRF